MSSLKTFESHGVVFVGSYSEEQHYGTCPFCDGEEKFYVDAKTGLWDCKKCARKGNANTFLYQLWESEYLMTRPQAWKELAKHRPGLTPSTLEKAGCARRGDGWLIPVWGDSEESLAQLRVYRPGSFMKNTSGMGVALYHPEGVVEKSLKGQRVWLCEGEWDAMTLWQENVDGYVFGVPGSGVWKEKWTETLRDTELVVAYDCDEAGRKGRERVVSEVSSNVQRVELVEWPKDAPEGFDVRDLLVLCNQEEDEFKSELESLVAQLEVDSNNSPDFNPVEQSLEDLERALGRYMVMSESTLDALRVVAAVVVANRMERSNPLWMFLVGSPSSGKTQLVTAMQNTQDVSVVTNVTPASLVSGMQGKQDPSLIPQLDGETMVIPDFTEILGKPSQEVQQILSILRTAYDGNVVRVFGNGVRREYDSTFGIIACTTPAIQAIQSTSFGERFIRFQIEDFSEQNQHAAAWSAIESVGSVDAREQHRKTIMKRFLEQDFLEGGIPSLSGKMKNHIIDMASVVSQMRTEVPRDHRDNLEYKPSAEAPYRLCAQFSKLARALLAIGVSEQNVKRILHKVAWDTSIQMNVSMMKAVLEVEGLVSVEELAEKTGLEQAAVTRVVVDLKQLGHIEAELVEVSGSRKQVRYKPSETIRRLDVLTKEW